MTDLEKLVSIIENNIEYTIYNDRDQYPWKLYPTFTKDVIVLSMRVIVSNNIEDKDLENMLSVWIFNKGGKFLTLGHWYGPPED